MKLDKRVVESIKERCSEENVPQLSGPLIAFIESVANDSNSSSRVRDEQIDQLYRIINQG